MATIMVKGQDVKAGDYVWSMGSPELVTHIDPYVHPVMTRNCLYRRARLERPGGFKAWGRTLAYDHGYMAGYEVTYTDGDPRTPAPSADDYLDPWLPQAAALWARYQADGMPGLWPDWVASLPPEDLPGPHPSGLACFTGVTPETAVSAASLAGPARQRRAARRPRPGAAGAGEAAGPAPA